ncbi:MULTISPECIES: 2-hydroxyacid dehydrogenase [unclassified Shinella]|uniref:2-hydroxyacid dehydrogenase n=1 Tax=unclassified Shinella TaxID=2643062 RepID=UPI00225CE712|nr:MULTISPECIES: 2-hydroxyacid dehydrogenase [unclassified Shinella]MCO5137682.1 2-hydroxyacid dehydrogenase [Shinella sp.]MDC7257800.1 2-hydroxyacid dehydrogenase [Shinella sp. YE25]CAI0335453.1 2-ketogluconate reductase [Rhizobiaceae bacterium]CAK7259760.1 2-ketogluconate reductase [Shinella sp. WSC3-e]
MKPDVLVAYPLRPRQMALLEEAYTVHRLDLLKGDDREAMLAEAGPRCTAMVVNGHVAIDDAFLARLPALKLAACSSAGYDQMDVAAMTRRGVTLTNTSDVLLDDVADMALLLMLAARRRLVVGDRYVRSGDWGRQGMMPLTTSTAGKRAGIVGLGRIGLAIARRCEAVGLTIGYYGRSRKTGNDYAYFDDPVKLAEWADILLVSTPGGAETEGLISASVLDALGPAGSLVNIARGSVVDEPALIRALSEGRIASAGLDVYYNEPNPDPAFAALDNVVLYPHHASGTEETRDRMAQLVIDNLAAFFAGKPLLTPVNGAKAARQAK